MKKCRPSYIKRYSKPKKWKHCKKIYGDELRVINWGMKEIDFAKLKWYRLKPTLKILNA